MREACTEPGNRRWCRRRSLARRQQPSGFLLRVLLRNRMTQQRSHDADVLRKNSIKQFPTTVTMLQGIERTIRQGHVHLTCGRGNVGGTATIWHDVSVCDRLRPWASIFFKELSLLAICPFVLLASHCTFLRKLRHRDNRLSGAIRRSRSWRISGLCESSPKEIVRRQRNNWRSRFGSCLRE